MALSTARYKLKAVCGLFASRDKVMKVQRQHPKGAQMNNLVTIYGGSGFVGRYIAQRMAKEGWRVRVAVRHPNEALFVKPYGAVGQVEPVLCNIRNDASVRAAAKGADVVVNCVGLLVQSGKNRFDVVQAEGAGRIARIAQEEGVARMVHLSAIGADAQSESKYARSKAQGEALVLASFPQAMILRPSVLFGNEDQFFNRFAAMSRMGPILPLVGAETLFQPAYVGDVAKASGLGILGTAAGGIYELGGPEVASFRTLMQQMLVVIERKRLILNIPYFIARLMAFGFDALQLLSGGLIMNPAVTQDQLINLSKDNVVSPTAKGFGDLGISPATISAVLPEYMWQYRPSGQYAAIKGSAKNLR